MALKSFIHSCRTFCASVAAYKLPNGIIYGAL